ncbi:MBL fold metallo-hydrolase [Candidatus Mcinerneyibacteriota bacterium]|nr:MBL fold metallo-hydrolase [Candidatus Mcinerneyibacteriota bacterium]
MEKITVTVLVENSTDNVFLLSEHGLSLLIESGPFTFLFDTGQGGALKNNMAQLGVSLDKVTHFILSHGHYDHGNGLPVFRNVNRRIPAFIHPMAVLPRYAVTEDETRYIGLCRDHLPLLESFEMLVKEDFTLFSLDERHFIGGHFAYENDFELTSGPFFIDEKGTVPDLFDDEIALGIKTQEGLIVISGCSHHGIVNITRQMLRYGGCSHVKAVIGGFHLSKASAQKREKTARELKKTGVQTVYAGHCTGGEALNSLKQVLGEENVHSLPAGAVISIENA